MNIFIKNKDKEKSGEEKKTSYCEVSFSHRG